MWYTIVNNKGKTVIVKEITPELALSKAREVFKKQSKVKGLKDDYVHQEAYWEDLRILEVKK